MISIQYLHKYYRALLTDSLFVFDHLNVCVAANQFRSIVWRAFSEQLAQKKIILFY